EMEGLSYEEIAELVACPVGTVRSRIHRARSELREILTRALANER
ncbi:MAG: sigma factor-like helix-turn-helix DNA-binding protein, partial [Planctomycetaceae bacterium]